MKCCATERLPSHSVARVPRDPGRGCGESFEVSVVSKQFAGKPALARHRLVHGALAGAMADIHALSIKQAITPEQRAAAAAAAAPPR